MRALVVDDSRVIRITIGRILKDAGYEVLEAGDGVQALECLRRQGVCDVALIDWNMPEMNGFDLLCAIRRDISFKAMPVIMVTTEAEMERMQQALDAGANDYIMKPFGKEAILEKIAMLDSGIDGDADG